MLKRLFGAMLIAAMVASPTVLNAQGPQDPKLAVEIVLRVAEHNCKVAQMLAELFNLKIKIPCKPTTK